MYRRKLIERIDARMVDELECVGSVLLAIIAAHAIGATNISWAAFSGYMVMRGHVADTLSRGALRIIGTIAGGLLSLAATPFLTPSLPLAALALALIGTASLYAALTAKRAYAWLFFGLTFAMVVFDKIDHPEIALGAFVETRILETLAGTLACVAVSLASGATLRRRWPASRAPQAQRAGWHPDALRLALQGGAALAALALLSGWLPLPALAQSAVTIMAVMLVPASGIGPSGFRPVSARIVQRFVGCIAGALLAALFLFTTFLFTPQAPAPLLILGTIVGVATGRHLENGDHSHRYVGTQFTLAILITLVPDSYASATIMPGLERLSGILIGMTVLEPILLAWHVLSPSRRAGGTGARPDEPGDI
ncbi:MAG: FUSC family protein [Candidatus Sphingomonas phytovorans]|nr:FUSC family protein [Sphingomonas sp.]WEJ99410.1 MAG: FUSC family protein [Sphingomonas sp.]